MYFVVLCANMPAFRRRIRFRSLMGVLNSEQKVVWQERWFGYSETVCWNSSHTMCSRHFSAWYGVWTFAEPLADILMPTSCPIPTVFFRFPRVGFKALHKFFISSKSWLILSCRKPVYDKAFKMSHMGTFFGIRLDRKTRSSLLRFSHLHISSLCLWFCNDYKMHKKALLTSA